MEKVIITALFALLVGCAYPNPKPVIEVQTVEIPIEYTPAPPKVERPALAIDTISSEDSKSIGLISEAYVVTVAQLEDYSKKLEAIIANYDDLSKHNLIEPDK
jgi:hypothetical protein